MNRDPDHVVLRLWARLPVVPGAVVTGVLVGAAGTLPWAALAGINLKYGSRWPWAVPIMALYLWGFWRYFVAGQGWPTPRPSGAA
jgi:hypothetical protein